MNEHQEDAVEESVPESVPESTDAELVSKLALIESQPLADRAEAYDQLYRQLSQQLD